MSIANKFSSLRQRQAFYDVPAGTDTSTVFVANGNFVDFYLNNMSNQLDQCSTLTLQLLIKNSDAASISVIPTFNFIELIEFYFNNDLLDSLRYDHLLVSHAFLDGNNTNNYGKLEGFTCNDNATTGGITSTITLAAGESDTYYIPIPNNIFCTNGLLLSALKGQIKLRVYFRTSSNLVYSGVATALTLQNIQVLASGIKYKDVELARSIITDDYSMDTIAHRWGVKNLQKISNTQQYDVSLEMLKGSMEYLFFYIKKSSASLKDYYQSDNPYYYDLLQFQLVDSNGTNSGFYSNMQSNFVKSLIPTQNLNSEWLSLFSIYMLPFCTDPNKSYDNNRHIGNELMDGKSYFRFQPNLDAALITGSESTDAMNLVVMGFQDAKLYIKNGVLSIEFL